MLHHRSSARPATSWVPPWAGRVRLTNVRRYRPLVRAPVERPRPSVDDPALLGEPRGSASAAPPSGTPAWTHKRPVTWRGDLHGMAGTVQYGAGHWSAVSRTGSGLPAVPPRPRPRGTEPQDSALRPRRLVRPHHSRRPSDALVPIDVQVSHDCIDADSLSCNRFGDGGAVSIPGAWKAYDPAGSTLCVGPSRRGEFEMRFSAPSMYGRPVQPWRGLRRACFDSGIRLAYNDS